MTLCQTHEMSTNLCGCGAASPAAPDLKLREVVRDFTAEREGKRGLRTPFHGCIVCRCPECSKLGAYCMTGKRGQRRATWVHEAVVSYLDGECKGYTSRDTCALTGDKLAAWLRARKRAAKRQQAVAS